MRRVIGTVVGALAITSCAGRTLIDCASSPPASVIQSAASVGLLDSAVTRWTFDGVAGTPPRDLELHATDGPPGKWVLRARADAPSGPTVLAQEDSSRVDGRYALAIAREPSYKDVAVSVRCLAFGGSIDRACGLVWRLRDAQNYYLARANALENNVRFYIVEAGRRQELASWSGPVTSCGWHTLRATMKDDHVEVFWNGQKVIDARDARLATPGRVGVWTKADSRSIFDDLSVTRIP